ncbi:MAG TPA: hypothetical protein VG297_04725 [Bryobacteraceae bacterium]|jgi:hypothetical protein|nr:hypothetical protein [Bryobacteraceae bacterium]
MKRIASRVIAFAFALTAAAATTGAPATGREIAAKLSSDLLGLNSVLVGEEPLQDDVYSREELQSLVTYSQNKVIQAYQRDIRSFESRRLRAAEGLDNGPFAFRTFASPDQAYKLTRALAGKDLSESNLMPLAEAIAGMIDSAIDCRNSESPVQDSARLRDAAQHAYDTLKNLRVSNHDTRVVIDALLRGAQALASRSARTTTIFK